MAVSSVGTPVFTRSSTSPVNSAWGTGQNRASGNLLVAVVSAIAQTTVTAPGAPAGWTKPVSATAGGRCSLGVFVRVATGGDAAPSFSSTLSGTGALTATLFELSGADPTTFLQAQGTATGTTTATLSVTTSTAVAQAGSYAVCGTGLELTTAATDTETPAANWSAIGDDSATSDVVHMAVIVNTTAAAGSALTGSTTWGAGGNSIAGVIAVFQPAMAPPVARRAPVRMAPPAVRRGKITTAGHLGQHEPPRLRPAPRLRVAFSRRGRATSPPPQAAAAPPAWVVPHRAPLRALALIRRRFGQLLPWPQATAPVIQAATSSPAVTAGGTSLATVTDPRDGGAAVTGGPVNATAGLLLEGGGSLLDESGAPIFDEAGT